MLSPSLLCPFLPPSPTSSEISSQTLQRNPKESQGSHFPAWLPWMSFFGFLLEKQDPYSPESLWEGGKDRNAFSWLLYSSLLALLLQGIWQRKRNLPLLLSFFFMMMIVVVVLLLSRAPSSYLKGHVWSEDAMPVPGENVFSSTFTERPGMAEVGSPATMSFSSRWRSFSSFTSSFPVAGSRGSFVLLAAGATVKSTQDLRTNSTPSLETTSFPEAIFREYPRQDAPPRLTPKRVWAPLVRASSSSFSSNASTRLGSEESVEDFTQTHKWGWKWGIFGMLFLPLMSTFKWSLMDVLYHQQPPPLRGCEWEVIFPREGSVEDDDTGVEEQGQNAEGRRKRRNPSSHSTLQLFNEEENTKAEVHRKTKSPPQPRCPPPAPRVVRVHGIPVWIEEGKREEREGKKTTMTNDERSRVHLLCSPPRRSWRVGVVLGSGGHTSEMLRTIRSFSVDASSFSSSTTTTSSPSMPWPRPSWKNVIPLYFYSSSDPHSKTIAQEMEQQCFHREGVRFVSIPRARSVGQRYWTAVFTTIYANAMCFLCVLGLWPPSDLFFATETTPNATVQEEEGASQETSAGKTSTTTTTNECCSTASRMEWNAKREPSPPLHHSPGIVLPDILLLNGPGVCVPVVFSCVTWAVVCTWLRVWLYLPRVVLRTLLGEASTIHYFDLPSTTTITTTTTNIPTGTSLRRTFRPLPIPSSCWVGVGFFGLYLSGFYFYSSSFSFFFRLFFGVVFFLLPPLCSFWWCFLQHDRPHSSSSAVSSSFVLFFSWWMTECLASFLTYWYSPWAIVPRLGRSLWVLWFHPLFQYQRPAIIFMESFTCVSAPSLTLRLLLLARCVDIVTVHWKPLEEKIRGVRAIESTASIQEKKKEEKDADKWWLAEKKKRSWPWCLLCSVPWKRTWHTIPQVKNGHRYASFARSSFDALLSPLPCISCSHSPITMVDPGEVFPLLVNISSMPESHQVDPTPRGSSNVKKKKMENEVDGTIERLERRKRNVTFSSSEEGIHVPLYSSSAAFLTAIQLREEGEVHHKNHWSSLNPDTNPTSFSTSSSLTKETQRRRGKATVEENHQALDDDDEDDEEKTKRHTKEEEERWMRRSGRMATTLACTSAAPWRSMLITVGSTSFPDLIQQVLTTEMCSFLYYDMNLTVLIVQYGSLSSGVVRERLEAGLIAPVKRGNGKKEKGEKSEEKVKRLLEENKKVKKGVEGSIRALLWHAETCRRNRKSKEEEEEAMSHAGSLLRCRRSGDEKRRYRRGEEEERNGKRTPGTPSPSLQTLLFAFGVEDEEEEDPLDSPVETQRGVSLSHSHLRAATSPPVRMAFWEPTEEEEEDEKEDPTSEDDVERKASARHEKKKKKEDEPHHTSSPSSRKKKWNESALSSQGLLILAMPYLPRLDRLVHECTYVVSHAGAGTILEGLEAYERTSCEEKESAKKSSASKEEETSRREWEANTREVLQGVWNGGTLSWPCSLSTPTTTTTTTTSTWPRTHEGRSGDVIDGMEHLHGGEEEEARFSLPLLPPPPLSSSSCSLVGCHPHPLLFVLPNRSLMNNHQLELAERLGAHQYLLYTEVSHIQQTLRRTRQKEKRLAWQATCRQTLWWVQEELRMGLAMYDSSTTAPSSLFVAYLMERGRQEQRLYHLSQKGWEEKEGLVAHETPKNRTHKHEEEEDDAAKEAAVEDGDPQGLSYPPPLRVFSGPDWSVTRSTLSIPFSGSLWLGI